MQKCPECNGTYFGNVCKCGYTTATSQSRRGPIICAWLQAGRRCLLQGAIGSHIPTDTKNYPSMYCGFHFQCLISPSMAFDKQAFMAWILQRSPELMESSFNWVDYYWQSANGFRANMPPDSAFDYKEKVCQFDPNDIQQVKGLAILKLAAPKLYERIVLKYPEMKAKAEALGKIKIGIQDMNEVLDTKSMPEEQKEELRRRVNRRAEVESENMDNLSF